MARYGREGELPIVKSYCSCEIGENLSKAKVVDVKPEYNFPALDKAVQNHLSISKHGSVWHSHVDGGMKTVFVLVEYEPVRELWVYQSSVDEGIETKVDIVRLENDLFAGLLAIDRCDYCESLATHKGVNHGFDFVDLCDSCYVESLNNREEHE